MDKGEIWLANLPQWTGREQLGTRPVIIMADSKIGMIIIIPLTSNLSSLKYPHTIEIKSSKQNGLDKESVALIFQIKSIDEKRMIHKIGMLEDGDLNKIEGILRELIKL